MKRPPTIEEAQSIHEIAVRVTATIDFKTEAFSWGTLTEKREAYAIMESLGIDRPQKSCFSCYVSALGKLMATIGLEGFAHPSEERRDKRLAMCHTCPAYKSRTQSCGRLITELFTPKQVLVDGKNITPCGCFLPIKASLKHSHCPAGRW